MFRRFSLLALAIPVLLLCNMTAFAAERAAIVIDKSVAKPAAYGIGRLQAELINRGFSVSLVTTHDNQDADYYIFAATTSDQGETVTTIKKMGIVLPKKAESLIVRRTIFNDRPAVVLCGADPRGLMYAALDTAERLSWSDGNDPFEHIEDVNEVPFVAERAISIYTMQRAYFESRLYDENQWKAYFDMLAKSRINSFVVIFGYENGGFMAPAYPYFFDVEQFPDVQLVGITSERQKQNVDAFRRMIEIAHQRGIDVTVGIWDHIYRGGVQGGGIAGASEKAGERVPGLVYGVTSDNLTSYNKVALVKFLDTFPELDGLQLRMHNESGLRRNEMAGFWHEVFQMIRQKYPNMRVDLRAKELPDAIIDDALAQGLKIRVATKYWMEQMGMPFHPTHVNRGNQHDRRHGYADLLKYPRNYQVHWRMWNGGTTRFLLWGDPDYVRRFAKSTHVGGGNSFEVNEMLATKMLGEPHNAKPFDLLQPDYQYSDYEFQRYWYYYGLWGRLTYNPETSTEIWRHEFNKRFGAESGEALQEGLALASQVLPRIVAASYNYRLFPTTRGWAEMMRVYDLPQYAAGEGSDIQQFMNVRDEALSILNGTDTAMRRPEETSQWFLDISDRILKQVARAEKATGNKRSNEFQSTICDLKILSGLARYHAHRLRAGVNYNFFKETGDLFTFDDAIREERAAIKAWESIVRAADGIYNEDLAFGVQRTGFSRHWAEELDRLREGLKRLIADRDKAKLQVATKAFGIAHVPPRRIEPGDSLLVRATVFGTTDPKVSLIAHADGNILGTIPMRHVAANQYQAILGPEIPSGRVEYSIKVVDSPTESSSKEQTAECTASFEVSADRTPPTAIISHGKKATPDTAFKVSATITDSSGIKWARLRYRHLTQFEDYQSVDMHFNPNTERYEAEIHGDFIDNQWDIMFLIETVDRAGNGRMFPDLEKEMPYIIIPTR